MAARATRYVHFAWHTIWNVIFNDVNVRKNNVPDLNENGIQLTPDRSIFLVQQMWSGSN